MKNLMKLSVVLVAAALAFSSCNCFKKMAKNRDDIKLTVTPEILTLNNGTVAADINVTFPVEYFNKKAIIKVTPVIVFEGGEVAGATQYYQGSKVDENYAVVDMSNGGNYTQHVGFPYDPRMDQCALQLRAEIKCPKGKAKEFVLVNLNTGAIPTKEQAAVLAGNDAAAKAAIAKEFGLTVAYGLNTLQKDLKYGDLMDQMANNYKKITTVVDKTDLLYAINSSVVTKKNEKNANLGAFKENVDKNLTNEKAEEIWYSSANDGYCGGIDHQHYNSTRYHGVNLHAFFTKGTVEFRLFNSTLHAGKIKAYIQFCLAVSAWAITSNDKLVFRSMDNYTAEQKVTIMRNILTHRLGLYGDEFKTCRLHMMNPLKKAAGMAVREAA